MEYDPVQFILMDSRGLADSRKLFEWQQMWQWHLIGPKLIYRVLTCVLCRQKEDILTEEMKLISYLWYWKIDSRHTVKCVQLVWKYLMSHRWRLMSRNQLNSCISSYWVMVLNAFVSRLVQKIDSDSAIFHQWLLFQADNV